MSAWAEVLTTVLLGTRRRKFTGCEVGGALGNALANPPGARDSDRVLSAAALIAAYRQAGWLDNDAAWEALAPPPVEERPRCSEAAAKRLRRMLEGQFRETLPEFVACLDRAGKRLPEELLPALLGQAASWDVLRNALGATPGARGRWLAGYNAGWSGQEKEIEASCWEHGGRMDRVRFLHQRRQRDPEAARAMLEAAWEAEPPEMRADLLMSLNTRLSMDDEPFLEKALDDRDERVSRNAVKLLVRLAESRLVKRMTERAMPHLRLETAPPPMFRPAPPPGTRPGFGSGPASPFPARPQSDPGAGKPGQKAGEKADDKADDKAVDWLDDLDDLFGNEKENEAEQPAPDAKLPDKSPANSPIDSLRSALARGSARNLPPPPPLPPPAPQMRLNAVLPDALDDALKRDGIGQQGPFPFSRLGDKGLWLSQILGCVPPAVWCAAFERPALELIQAAGRGNALQPILTGLQNATLNFRDAEWAEAFIDEALALGGRFGGFQVSTGPLLGLLTPAQREAALTRVFRAAKLPLAADRGGLTMLEQCAHPWSEAFTRVVLSGVIDSLSNPATHNHWPRRRSFGASGMGDHVGNWLKEWGLNMAPTLYPEIAAACAEAKKAHPEAAAALDNLVELLTFRLEMREDATS